MQRPFTPSDSAATLQEIKWEKNHSNHNKIFPHKATTEVTLMQTVHP